MLLKIQASMLRFLPISANIVEYLFMKLIGPMSVFFPIFRLEIRFLFIDWNLVTIGVPHSAKIYCETFFSKEKYSNTQQCI